MAINTVISTDDLTVLGPPASIDLSLDIGPAGTRGSIFYSGSGDPNINTAQFTSNPPNLNDLYIRTDLGGDYGTVYKYVSQPGGSQWSSILKFQPINYNDIRNVTFTSGSASITVILDDFYVNAPANLTTDQIAVQLTSENDVPLVLSVTGKTLTSGTTRTFITTIAGAEYSGGSWANMSGSANINLNLTLVE
jgi:hypothetical protein